MRTYKVSYERDGVNGEYFFRAESMEDAYKRLFEDGEFYDEIDPPEFNLEITKIECLNLKNLNDFLLGR